MSLAPLNAHALSLPILATLLAGAAVTAALLAHTLRKSRSADWVVAFGWGAGGAFGVGTGLWALQLALWHATQSPATAWFVATPFVGAWVLAVATSAAGLLLARWLPNHCLANAATLLLLLPLLMALFVALGAAMAMPPNWQAQAAGPYSHRKPLQPRPDGHIQELHARRYHTHRRESIRGIEAINIRLPQRRMAHQDGSTRNRLQQLRLHHQVQDRHRIRAGKNRGLRQDSRNGFRSQTLAPRGTVQ